MKPAQPPTVHIAGALPLRPLDGLHWMLATWTPFLTSKVTQPTELEPGLVLNWPWLKLVPAARPSNPGEYVCWSLPMADASLVAWTGRCRNSLEGELGGSQVVASWCGVESVVRQGVFEHLVQGHAVLHGRTAVVGLSDPLRGLVATNVAPGAQDHRS